MDKRKLHVGDTIYNWYYGPMKIVEFYGYENQEPVSVPYSNAKYIWAEFLNRDDIVSGVPPVLWAERHRDWIYRDVLRGIENRKTFQLGDRGRWFYSMPVAALLHYAKIGDPNKNSRLHPSLIELAADLICHPEKLDPVRDVPLGYLVEYMTTEEKRRALDEKLRKAGEDRADAEKKRSDWLEEQRNKANNRGLILKTLRADANREKKNLEKNKDLENVDEYRQRLRVLEARVDFLEKISPEALLSEGVKAVADAKEAVLEKRKDDYTSDGDLDVYRKILEQEIDSLQNTMDEIIESPHLILLLDRLQSEGTNKVKNDPLYKKYLFPQYSKLEDKVKELTRQEEVLRKMKEEYGRMETVDWDQTIGEDFLKDSSFNMKEFKQEVIEDLKRVCENAAHTA